MIAVTFALPSESSGFRRLLSDRQDEVVILHTGVGAEVSRHRIQSFLDARHYEFLISAGFAGGVDPSLRVGDLLLAENFSDSDLLARARDAIIARVATLATAERIIESAQEREQFARERGAAAVDMETKWIAQACAARKIPLLSLRVISDTAIAPLPAPAFVLFNLPRQRTEPLVLARYLGRHPASIVRLMRFARQVAAARASLTAALATVLRELV